LKAKFNDYCLFVDNGLNNSAAERSNSGVLASEVRLDFEACRGTGDRLSLRVVPGMNDLTGPSEPSVYNFHNELASNHTWRMVCSVAEPRAEGNSMPASAQIITYSKPATALGKVFGSKGSEVSVAVRASKDVPKFLQKLGAARKKSAHSTLRFK
jgi:hypothetical protein